MVYLVTSDNAGVIVPSVHCDFCLCRDDFASLVTVTSKSDRSEAVTGRLSWSLTNTVFRWTDCRLTVLLSSRELPANDPCRGNPGIAASDWTELVTFSEDRSACNKQAHTHIVTPTFRFRNKIRPVSTLRQKSWTWFQILQLMSRHLNNGPKS